MKATMWKMLQQLLNKRQFMVRELGNVGGPIPLLGVKKDPVRKSVLVATGFHGDEHISLTAVMRWLNHLECPEGVLLSVIPIVSPSGYTYQAHLNRWGEDPAMGHLPGGSLSREGKVLHQHLDLLKGLAKDGYVELHDGKRRGVYEEDPFSATVQAQYDLARKLEKSLKGEWDSVKYGRLDRRDQSLASRMQTEGVPSVLVECNWWTSEQFIQALIETIVGAS